METRDVRKNMRAMRLLQRSIVPDAAWVTRTRVTILARVSQEASSLPLSLKERLKRLAHYFFPSKMLAVLRGPALAVLSVFGIVAGGSIASVSAAEYAIPGDLLYPVKLVTEQTRLMLTKGKAEKIKLKTQFVGRRIQEMKDIVASNVEEKDERMKTATDLLKRDLDTVKHQLNEVSEESTGNAVEAAKIVDDQSLQFAASLQEVKMVVSEEMRGKVREAEVAAVNTSVRAVQVLIDSQDQPEGQSAITNADLVESINQKVINIQAKIVDTAQTLVDTGLVSTTSVQDMLSPTSTNGTHGTRETQQSATSSLGQIQNAQASLTQAKQLLEEKKLGDLPSILMEATHAVSEAEIEILVQGRQNVSSSTDGVPALVSSTSSHDGVASQATSSSQESVSSPKIDPQPKEVKTEPASSSSP